MVKVPHKSPRGPVVIMAPISPFTQDPLMWKFVLTTNATGWEDLHRKEAQMVEKFSISGNTTMVVLCKLDASRH